MSTPNGWRFGLCLLCLAVSDNPMLAVWPNDFPNDGRAIAAQCVADSPVQFRKLETGIFFAGDNQERADIFLRTASRSLEGVFGDENNRAVKGRVTIGVGLNRGRKKAA